MSSSCQETAVYLKTFFVYFHKETKDIMALDYKKPDWLMAEQPWYVLVGKFTASYQELTKDVVVPASTDGRFCCQHDVTPGRTNKPTREGRSSV